MERNFDFQLKVKGKVITILQVVGAAAVTLVVAQLLLVGAAVLQMLLI